MRAGKQNETQPEYRLAYSIVEHPYIGYIAELHAVNLTSNGNFSLSSQKIRLQTADYYKVPEEDVAVLKMIEELESDVILQRFYKGKKRIRANDFYAKFFTEVLYENEIKPYVEKRMSKIMNCLSGKVVFLAGKDNHPLHQQVEVSDNKADILFHFRRNENGTHYFVTIKHEEKKLEFAQNNSKIVVSEPAWIAVGEKIITFKNEISGSKLKPFLHKKFIDIPKNAEPSYYEKFVKNLLEDYDVYAKGFEIQTETHKASPLVRFVNLPNGLFALALSFKYDAYEFPYHSTKMVSVTLRAENDEYVFKKIRRSRQWEDFKRVVLETAGFELIEGSLFLPKGLDLQPIENLTDQNRIKAITLLVSHKESFKKAGFKIDIAALPKKYLLVKPQIQFNISESKDWFDLYATVTIGKFEFSFLKLRPYILAGKTEFELPDGSIALLPEEWFGKLTDLFDFGKADGEKLILKNHHKHLVQEQMANGGAFKDVLPETPQTVSIPKNFTGNLRPYQMQGFEWLLHMRNHNFGACLADDMGLGKTIQCLAVLQYVKENKQLVAYDTAAPKANIALAENIDLFGNKIVNETDETANTSDSRVNMVVVPASLLYNWEIEAKKFTKLKVLVYSGYNRNKNFVKSATKYDLIITTYGTLRNDIEVLKTLPLHYLILDEAQIIKNPASQTAKSATEMNAAHRMVLTGTPIENSVIDIWSQMNFLNPGLLGSYALFQRKYQFAIEKLKSEEKTEDLRKLIAPYILRRTKGEVAADLPEKYEQVLFCEMTEEQEKLYEKTKSFYRNEIIKSVASLGINKSHLTILKGLMKLRQLANHPAMLEKSYLGDSGKFNELLAMTESVLRQGHKVLVFSQFVRQLNILRNHFDATGVTYNYLDGATSPQERQFQVQDFQKSNDARLFLISLKAGGVGLNLTAADYVFIIDPWWNPALERQAMDRTHRIGQDKKVFVYKFITRNTVEEKILKLQEQKKKIANDLIGSDRSFLANIDIEDIENILT